jgi:hypothetical protein
LKFGSIKIKLNKDVKDKEGLRYMIKEWNGVQDVWYVDHDLDDFNSIIMWDLFVELKVADRMQAEEINNRIQKRFDVAATKLNVEIDN